MLVLSRKVGEKLVIGDNITVVVSRISGNRVTLAIEAPQDVRIVRGELKAIEVPPKEPTAQANRAENFDSSADARSASLLRLAK
jgi:carbon storage regulator CsrA